MDEDAFIALLSSTKIDNNRWATIVPELPNSCAIERQKTSEGAHPQVSQFLSDEIGYVATEELPTVNMNECDSGRSVSVSIKFDPVELCEKKRRLLMTSKSPYPVEFPFHIIDWRNTSNNTSLSSMESDNSSSSSMAPSLSETTVPSDADSTTRNVNDIGIFDDLRFETSIDCWNFDVDDVSADTDGFVFA